MERTKQKSKKEKPNKFGEKDKPSSSGTDAKTIEENIKIREILRTVKMNSSMRIKAPRGSKVMHNKDFNEHEDVFEDLISSEGHLEPASATNVVLNSNIDSGIDFDGEYVSFAENLQAEYTEPRVSEEVQDVDVYSIKKSKSLAEGLDEISIAGDPEALNSTVVPTSPRKLSLDQKMLSRSEGLSQSEVDLHAIGKLPLERKSSFFRKKMDSFLKNTTEIFKRKSKSGKSTNQRRDSNTSQNWISLQSLNENVENESISQNHEHGSVTSLRSTLTARSNSSVTVSMSELPPHQSKESLASSRQTLESQMLEVPASYNLNAADSLLNTRAISMSSGLNTATGIRRRKTSTTSRFNRVTWLASESVMDYFHTVYPVENSENMKGSSSYQDFSTIPENTLEHKTDSKGRRLSYMRAVAGEDPAHAKNTDSNKRKKNLRNESRPASLSELAITLNEFAKNGIPKLPGYTMRKISNEATAYLKRFSVPNSLTVLTDFFSDIPGSDQNHHAVVLELAHSEIDHIKHLIEIADVYLAVAHALQERGLMTELESSNLFLNIPDVLNANVLFWEKTLFPMLYDAKEGKTAFNTSLTVDGFMTFHEIFEPYEVYVQKQAIVGDVLRDLNQSEDFIAYLNWCNVHTGNRLQLSDILVKPMQRLAKYNLLVLRLISYITDENKKMEMVKVEAHIRSFLLHVNRGVRQRDELNVMWNLNVERYEPQFKGDDEIAKRFRKFKSFELFGPLLECGQYVMRTLVHQGDLRFRDHLKEFDAFIMLFSDLLLVCKKYTKANRTRLRMVRPRYLLKHTVPYIQPGKGTHDLPTFIYVVLDEFGVSHEAFMLTETNKDPDPVQTMKVWEQKIQEAMMAYELMKWYNKYPVNDLAIIETEYHTEEFKKANPDRVLIEKRARDRVAAMLHPNMQSSRDSSQERPEVPLTDFERARGPPNLHDYCAPGNEAYRGFANYRGFSVQQSTASHSSQVSQYLSSSDLRASLSGGSHEELPSIAFQRSAGSSLDHGHQDDVPPSITVDIVGDNEFEALVPSRLATPPLLVLQASSPNQSTSGPGSNSADSQLGSENTLRVSPSHSGALRSLPDLSTATLQPSPHAASTFMYQVHMQHLERNRLTAGHQFLTTNHRGSSYPPPSSLRSSLTRGFGFSQSLSTPYRRLTRSQNIDRASPIQNETPSFAEHIFQKFAARRSTSAEPRPGRKSKASHKSPSLSARTTPTASTMDIIAKEMMAGTSKGSKSKSPVPKKKEQTKKPSLLARSPKFSVEKSDDSELELSETDNVEAIMVEDDCSTRSSKSAKSSKSTKSHSQKQNIFEKAGPSKQDKKKDRSSKTDKKDKEKG